MDTASGSDAVVGSSCVLLSAVSVLGCASVCCVTAVDGSMAVWSVDIFFVCFCCDAVLESLVADKPTLAAMPVATDFRAANGDARTLSALGVVGGCVCDGSTCAAGGKSLLRVGISGVTNVGGLLDISSAIKCCPFGSNATGARWVYRTRAVPATAVTVARIVCSDNGCADASRKDLNDFNAFLRVSSSLRCKSVNS